jgi:hypothetical protein
MYIYFNEPGFVHFWHVMVGFWHCLIALILSQRNIKYLKSKAHIPTHGFSISNEKEKY